MWAYGRHYRVESVDVKRRSFDCGIMVDFKQSSRASSKDKNIIEGNLQYVGKIQEIIELDYRSFKCCIFKCRWYEAFERTRRHDSHSGLFSIDSSRLLPEDKEPYVLPIHCEQVFLKLNQDAVVINNIVCNTPVLDATVLVRYNLLGIYVYLFSIQ